MSDGSVVIIDYGIGNLQSIAKMIQKAGGAAKISTSRDDIENATRLVFPGVGSFDSAMRSLERSGLIPILKRQVLEKQVPTLGICLGMQLMTRRSEEGKLSGLGWLRGETYRFALPSPSDLRVPHMQWNRVFPRHDSPLFACYPEPPRFYFVHSYHCAFDDPNDVAATCIYGYEFACAVRCGNIYGTQFHPEKSHQLGIRMMRNFLRLPVASA